MDQEDSRSDRSLNRDESAPMGSSVEEATAHLQQTRRKLAAVPRQKRGRRIAFQGVLWILGRFGMAGVAWNANQPVHVILVGLGAVVFGGIRLYQGLKKE